MNISYKWLKEYIDFDLTPQQVAEALTSLGLEVGATEEVETIRGGLKGLVVKVHGNTDGREIKHAVQQCYDFVKADAVNKIAASIEAEQTEASSEKAE